MSFVPGMLPGLWVTIETAPSVTLGQVFFVSRESGVHFWIPLQAVTESNGCMWFIPRSHQGPLRRHRLLNRRTNGSNRTVAGGTLVTDHVDESRAIACPLAVGGVTVHHPLTLHYTGANQTNHCRKAWILHFGAYGWFRRRLHPKVLMARVASWI